MEVKQERATVNTTLSLISQWSSILILLSTFKLFAPKWWNFILQSHKQLHFIRYGLLAFGILLSERQLSHLSLWLGSEQDIVSLDVHSSVAFTFKETVSAHPIQVPIKISPSYWSKLAETEHIWDLPTMSPSSFSHVCNSNYRLPVNSHGHSQEAVVLSKGRNCGIMPLCSNYLLILKF